MAFSDVKQMMYGQLFQTPPSTSVDLSGRTVIVTGANTGLGLEAAKQLHQLKVSHLILACRNLSKGEKARKEILSSSRLKSPGKIEVWQLDMSSYNSVLVFGDRINSLSRLDAFLANAGIDVSHFELFEGTESTITVNVISTFLVSLLAIPKLRETSKMQGEPSRLVVTGSVVHIQAKHQYLVEPKQGQIFKSLNDEKTADMEEDRYHLSKLLVLLCIRELAKKLERSSKRGNGTVVINNINPGWCKTELFRTADGGAGGRIGLKLIGRTAEKGGRTLVHGAVVDKEVNGKYLSECRVKPESVWVRSEEGARIQEKVWGELVDILESIRPGITNL